MEQESVLITGGGGLIGRYLTTLLIDRGYRVSHLSRKAGPSGSVTVFKWDPDNNFIDPSAINGIDHIIHLAGANIGEGRWTAGRKSEILSSRIGSVTLLNSTIKQGNYRIRSFISASAAGYYGAVTSDRIFTETDPPADDFLGSTCRKWEESAGKFSELGIRTVKIRTGVVMEKSDGALSRFLAAARFGIFPVLGGGHQYMPWIHIADLCEIYLKALQDESMSGSYNAVSPCHLNNIEFMRILARVKGKPFFHPPVPAFLLRIIMGESSVVALKGSRISSEKIIKQGFKFRFPDPEEALRNTLLCREEF
jgi:uncharacterized protein (TIGR01777 family)